MKMYTAEEMREMALVEESYRWDVVAEMLRQAADMMDRAERLIADRDNWRRQALDEDARANAATIKESLTVGNTAAMLAALEQIHELLSIGGKPDTSMCIRYEAAYQIAKEVLSSPPRNCDRYTIAEALRKYGFSMKSNPWGEKEWLDFYEWLFAEAKGENDGSR